MTGAINPNNYNQMISQLTQAPTSDAISASQQEVNTLVKNLETNLPALTSQLPSDQLSALQPAIANVLILAGDTPASPSQITSAVGALNTALSKVLDNNPGLSATVNALLASIASSNINVPSTASSASSGPSPMSLMSGGATPTNLTPTQAQAFYSYLQSQGSLLTNPQTSIQINISNSTIPTGMAQLNAILPPNASHPNVVALNNAYNALENLPANPSTSQVTAAVDKYNSALAKVVAAHPHLASELKSNLTLPSISSLLSTGGAQTSS